MLSSCARALARPGAATAAAAAGLRLSTRRGRTFGMLALRGGSSGGGGAAKLAFAAAGKPCFSFMGGTAATALRRTASLRAVTGPSLRQTPLGSRRLMSADANAASGGLMDRVLWFPRTFPFTFQALFATGKTAISDLVVQKVIEKKEEIDWKRNAVFAAFGFGYLGLAQWFFYVTCMKRLFPKMGEFASKPLREKLKDGPGLRALVGQVGFDNFVVTPFFYFPFFYVFKQSIQGDLDLSNMDWGGIGADAWAKYRKNMYEDWAAMWSLWVPGDFIIYAIPVWMRLPANHMLSLVWTMILSYFRGDAIEDDATASAAVAEASEGTPGNPTMVRRRSRRGRLPLPDEVAPEVGGK